MSDLADDYNPQGDKKEDRADILDSFWEVDYRDRRRRITGYNEETLAKMYIKKKDTEYERTTDTINMPGRTFGNKRKPSMISEIGRIMYPETKNGQKVDSVRECDKPWGRWSRETDPKENSGEKKKADPRELETQVRKAIIKKSKQSTSVKTQS